MTARYQRIQSVVFDGAELPLPVSVRLSHQAAPLPARGSHQRYATSVETDGITVSAEVTVRGTAAAEGLAIGQKGQLSILVCPASDGAPQRSIVLTGAVLVAVELSYRQSAMAEACLRFVTEADDGNQAPFVAEDYL